MKRLCSSVSFNIADPWPIVITLKLSQVKAINVFWTIETNFCLVQSRMHYSLEGGAGRGGGGEGRGCS